MAEAMGPAALIKSIKLPPRPMVRSAGKSGGELKKQQSEERAMQMADAFIAPQFERSDRPFNASSTARSVATIWRHAVSGRPIQWRKDPTEWNKIEGMIFKQLAGVTAFLDGLVTYVLSREWHDLFSFYIFRLQPLPHCSEEFGVRFGFFGIVKITHHQDVDMQAPSCIEEADSARQTVCVVLLLCIAAFVHAMAQRHMSPTIAAAVTSIAGTTVGWAAGDATVRRLVELSPNVLEGGVESNFDILFALGVTSLGVIAMLLLEPFTVHASAAMAHRAAEKWCCAGPALDRFNRAIDVTEEAMLSMTHLTGRAVTMAVLMIWTYVSQLNLLAGLTPEQKGGPLQFRLQLLWSITLTLTSALATEQLVAWREQLEQQQVEEAANALLPPSPSPASAPVQGAAAHALAPAPAVSSLAQAPRTYEKPYPNAAGSASTAGLSAAGPSGAGAATDAAGGGEATMAMLIAGEDGALVAAKAARRAKPKKHRFSHAWQASVVDPLFLWVQGARQTLREALRRCLSFAEQLCFFATGWSWTYVFFPLASKSSILLVVKDGLVALSLTTLAVILIVLLPGERLAHNHSGRISILGSAAKLSGGGSGAATSGAAHGASTARMAIVKQTLTTSSTFFVGWAYVVFFRDLAAITGSTSLKLRQAFSGNFLDSLSGGTAFGLVKEEEAMELESQTDYTAFAGALGGVLFFGPILSIGVLSAKYALLARFAAMGASSAGPPREDMLRLQRATVRAKLARLGMIQPEQRAPPAPRSAALLAVQAQNKELTA